MSALLDAAPHPSLADLCVVCAMPPKHLSPGPHGAIDRSQRQQGSALGHPPSLSHAADSDDDSRDIAAAIMLLEFHYSATLNEPQASSTSPSGGVLNGVVNNNGFEVAPQNHKVLEEDGSGDVVEILEHAGTGGGSETVSRVGAGADGRYFVLGELGAGTFGQVFKCLHEPTTEEVAVKVVKSHWAYTAQACREISILRNLKEKMTEDEKRCVVDYKRHFYCKGHLCLVFELLSDNLFDLCRLRHHQTLDSGLGLEAVQVMLSQLCIALAALDRAKIIHGDIKPENIVLTGKQTNEIKLIDFGSAFQHPHQIHDYVQSRFYRSPEILLGAANCNAKIDVWSLGCVAAELFLGQPLFPGESLIDMLIRIDETLGPFPTAFLRRCQHTHEYFDVIDADPGFCAAKDDEREFYLKSPAGYAGEGRDVGPHEKNHLLPMRRLHDIIMNERTQESRVLVANSTTADAAEAAASTPSVPDLANATSSADTALAMAQANDVLLRTSFSDLLHGMLRINPEERLTPDEVSRHPFCHGHPFSGRAW